MFTMSDAPETPITPEPTPNTGKVAVATNNALGKVGMELKDDALQFYKKVSVLMFALVAAAPDIYNAAITSGMFTADTVPPAFAWFLKAAAFVGIISKLVQKQQTGTGS
jgi:hypothetical protein